MAALTRRSLRIASRTLCLSGVKPRSDINRTLHLTGWPRLMPAGASHHSPDYYAVLGITRAATLPEVKLAYFKQAKKYHPDTSNASQESQWMFELVAEAYDVLSDEKKRKEYDEYGTTGHTFGGTAGGPKPPKDHLRYDSEELFERIFGEAKTEAEAKTDGSEDYASNYYGHGSMKEYLIQLSFEEAAKGVKDYYIDLNIRAICPKCRGSKSEMGYTWQVCMCLTTYVLQSSSTKRSVCLGLRVLRGHRHRDGKGRSHPYPQDVLLLRRHAPVHQV